jgi:hypothetical protein
MRPVLFQRQLTTFAVSVFIRVHPCPEQLRASAISSAAGEIKKVSLAGVLKTHLFCV